MRHRHPTGMQQGVDRSRRVLDADPVHLGFADGAAVRLDDDADGRRARARCVRRATAGVGRGAMGSTGYSTTINEFGQQRDLSNQRSQLGYDSSMADLSNQGNQLDLNQEMYKNTSNEDKAKAQDRIKTLQLVADSFGIKKEQLQAALNRSVAENGLSEFTSANQILDMMASNDVQQKQLAMNVINQAMNAQGSGVNPAQLGFK